MGPSSISNFFLQAVGESCFGFQERFARELPALVNIPTGLGKTAMAVVGWLWRRFGAGDELRRQTPRRLVYCLPMRVLVEQTRDNAIRWLHNVGRLGGEVTFDPPLSWGRQATPNDGVAKYVPSADKPGTVAVYVLMGGEDEDDWDLHPEREAIIIGTQDMLLSRALNRGYAASRSRWPMQFGLLNTDCLWVFDEIQLMGSGLATTAQLEAFRRLLPTNESPHAKEGHGCLSVWMSATLDRKWLETVDFKDRVGNLVVLELDKTDHDNEEIKKRWAAKKPLGKSSATMGDAASLADEVRKAHKRGTRTIVVVNTVKRAYALFEALRTSMAGGSKAQRGRRGKGADTPVQASPGDQTPKVVLLHSRFRPPDRAERVEEALADPPPEGTIVVSTQVIEAGVDVSAATLFTELAPWASLVQRFGRCNRRGEQNERASVRWIDVPDKDAAPYDAEDLRKARDTLGAIAEQPEAQRSVSLAALSALDVNLPFNHTHVIRRRDLIDLFDTTPDLAGNDIDIDRFVREVEDSDVRVFWRDYGDPEKGATPNNIGGKDAEKGAPRIEPAPRREELCPAPIGAVKKDTKGKTTYTEFRKFVNEHANSVWRWSFLDEKWEPARADAIAPGQVFLIHADAGGYSAKTGWDPGSTARVAPLASPSGAAGETLDGTDSDRLSRAGVWQTIAEHTDAVFRELVAIVKSLKLDGRQASVLKEAARHHDWGKAHQVFCGALPDGMPNHAVQWAKAPGSWKRYARRHFRHELASALAVLQRPHDALKKLRDDDLNLVAYLVAAHHGKVRLSIRSLPNEQRPNPRTDTDGHERRFARGVWDGDELPEVDLGQNGDGTRIIAPRVTLSLEPMELGLCEQGQFAGQPSWAERMIRLRDTLGPFRLAYLEAILRAADMRASRAATSQTADNTDDSEGASDG
ncbi:MAG: hypothetical protein HBSAPP02_21360 [Phycisphaerae bacterium]|nr:MAG: DEAD/DEAH box helicase [Planctomycetia bacterium]RIK67956.1 MAG: CRISPR-associated helicase/endonuclease Cas3 [Planctomycetota bacterium]GJQ27104.1 MAG: hypothetical protein HBSAPP02_21360 [Phycisphaerae bacterium]